MRSKNNISEPRRADRPARRRGFGLLGPAGGLLLALALACGCRSAALDRREALRIGTLADAPPIAFRQDGKWRGWEVELGRALAKRLGMKPVFVACPAGQLSDALLAGKVDVLMAGVAIDETLRTQMDFSTPYLVVGQTAIVRAEDLLRFNTEIKVRTARATVGVIRDSPGDELVSRYFANAKRVAFADAGLALDALMQRQVDLVVHDAPAAWWLSLRHPGKLALAPVLMARQEVAWGFRRSSVRLRESANQALADWEKDGTIEAVFRRWIPFSK
ncbi:MAG: substrate-binding periplasmic protein [Kiritimatiellia bacterium]